MPTLTRLAPPAVRPQNPCFSSGPCAKRPGWSLAALESALVGRSHRASAGKKRLQEVITRSRQILGIPDDYKLGIVPASDTGAVEMALWSLLGPRGVDVFAWESFGQGWVTDIIRQLKLSDTRVMSADYGQLPDLHQYQPDRDCVFTWNGTTSGVCVPHADWIPADHQGLTICDATSAAFAMPLDWPRLDVVTWSWQKVLGGEAAHGMLALSPRAVARLESYKPQWPMPKLFRLASGGKLIAGIFEADTINTPSMLAVEDALDGLRWAESVGGLSGLIARSRRNLAAIERWLAGFPHFQFLAAAPRTRSNTSVCLKFGADFQSWEREAQAALAKKIVTRLEQEKAGFDLGAYRDAPPGLRIWAGATVETSDLEALFPWIEWALEESRA